MDRLDHTALGQTVHHCVLPNGLAVYVDVRPSYSKKSVSYTHLTLPTILLV